VQTSAVNWVTLALPSDRIVEYKLSAAPATSGGAILDVMGYGVPNGAE
jgi:hypothetical protein